MQCFGPLQVSNQQNYHTHRKPAVYSLLYKTNNKSYAFYRSLRRYKHSFLAIGGKLWYNLYESQRYTITLHLQSLMLQVCSNTCINIRTCRYHQVSFKQPVICITSVLHMLLPLYSCYISNQKHITRLIAAYSILQHVYRHLGNETH